MEMEKFNDKMSKQLYADNITPRQIKKLVKEGADVNYQEKNRLSIPRHFASKTTAQDIENMKTIIHFGCDLSCDIRGRSCLSQAIEDSNEPMTLLLLSYETKKTFEKKRIDTTSLISIYQSLKIVQTLLTQEIITPNEGLEIAIQHPINLQQTEAIMKYLIENGTNNQDYLLLTALYERHASRFIRRNDIIRIFCKLGVYSKKALEHLENEQKVTQEIITAIKNNDPEKINEFELIK
jgi:hypothetical protein